MKTRVAAVQVSMPWYITADKFASMIANINAFMRKTDPSIPEVKPKPRRPHNARRLPREVLRRLSPPGVSPRSNRRRNSKGLTLDPTYTSKALYGGLDWLKVKGEREKVVLFMDTFNSVDLPSHIAGADYKTLPRSLHRYFEKPTQEEELAEKAL